MTCQYCRSRMFDLTHDKGAGRNYLCEKCGAHYYHPIKSYLKNEYYNAKWFTKIEWEKFVAAPAATPQVTP